jgi:hypothetical protein
MLVLPSVDDFSEASNGRADRLDRYAFTTSVIMCLCQRARWLAHRLAWKHAAELNRATVEVEIGQPERLGRCDNGAEVIERGLQDAPLGVPDRNVEGLIAVCTTRPAFANTPRH